MKEEAIYDPMVEEQVLGSMIIDYNCFLKGVAELSVNDFYEAVNKNIFQILLSLANEGGITKAEDVYMRTLEMAVVKYGERMREYILLMIEGVVATSLFDNSVKQLKKMTALRKIERTLINSLLSAKSRREADYILDYIDNQLVELRKEIELSSFFERIDKIIEEIRTKKIGNHITTTFADLDNMLIGYFEGDYIVVASRPSVGKTSFALSSIYNYSKLGIPSAIVSLEMPKQQIAMRIMSMELNLPLERIRKGDIDLFENRPIGIDNIYIDDVTPQNIASIRAKARRLTTEYGVKIIFIDYLQLIQSTMRHESRNVELMHISAGIKSLAKELNIPIVVLSQLNRRAEERSDNRPRLADLRESGAIEQDADVVILLRKDDEENNIRHFAVAKNRNGRIGEGKFTFIPEQARFQNFENEDILPF